MVAGLSHGVLGGPLLRELVVANSISPAELGDLRDEGVIGVRVGEK